MQCCANYNQVGSTRSYLWVGKWAQGEENMKNPSRRTLLASAAAGIATVVVAGSPASADTSASKYGVAEVLAINGDQLNVKLRTSGNTVRVPLRDFGELEVRRGDLVSVVPDQFAARAADRENLIAQPYIRVSHETGEVFTFNSTGESRLAGMHS